MPFTWIIFLIACSFFAKATSTKRRTLLTALLLMIFFSNTFIFDRFMHAWEVKAIPESSITHFDAAILLTGMSTYDPANKRLEFNDRTDRLMQTLKLYMDKKIDKIILCGKNPDAAENDSSEIVQLRNFMISLQVKSEDILIEATSQNTHENATFMKPILEKHFPGGKFLLISSGFHLRRATACFIKEGIKVIPYSTDRYSGPVKFDFAYLFIPSAQTLFNWEKLMHEWMGCGWYFLRGYI
jgi:uncharacterized SAM-binding protein YcdF (DUF218 family)